MDAEMNDRPKRNTSGQIELPLTKDTWPSLKPTLDRLLEKVVEGWKSKTSSEEDKRDSQQKGPGDSE